MKNKTQNQLILEGQLGFFDVEEKLIVETTAPAIRNIKIENIIKKYSDSCTRIAQIENMLLVELSDRTLVFNQYGELESTLDIDVMLRPKDKIIVSNVDKGLTEHQINTLKKVKTEVYVKRKSDNNIIIPYENFSIVIYPTGHLSKWMHKAIYKDDEMFNINDFPKVEKNKLEVQEVQLIQEEKLKVGDTVEFDYYGTIYKGTVVHMYNNDESINVSFNNGETSFYYKNLKKVS